MDEPPISAGPPMQPLPDQCKGGMQVFALVVSIVLLLPGVCAIIVVGIDPKGALGNPMVLTFLLMGAGGIALIWWGLRRPR